MRLVASEEIDAPIDRVWPRLTDFEAHEARLRAVRRSPPGPVGTGTTWRTEAEVLGTPRHIEGTLTRLEAPAHLAADARVDGLDVAGAVRLEPLDAGRTRMVVSLEAEARTFSARVLLQSAKLMRASLEGRFAARVRSFADRLGQEAGPGPA